MPENKPNKPPVQNQPAQQQPKTAEPVTPPIASAPEAAKPPEVKPAEAPKPLAPLAIPRPSHIVHLSDNRSEAFRKAMRTISFTISGEPVMKLIYGCGIGDVSKFVHCVRDNLLTEPQEVLDAARRHKFGCINCLTLLTRAGRIGAQTVEPEEADEARKDFGERNRNHLLRGHTGPVLTVDLTSEVEIRGLRLKGHG